MRTKIQAARSSFLPVAIAFSAIACILYFGPPVSTRKVPSTYLAPPGWLKHASFGYHENFSDVLWLRLIQDCDFCERASDAPVSAPIEPFAEATKREPSRCDRGWAYRLIEAAAELTPRFRILYSLGATMLSVLVDDREGARLIFERGLIQYPTDWSLAYRAAYHYLFEIGDKTRAAELLVLAGRNGGPPWTFSLAARIHTDRGQAAIAKPILEEALKRAPGGRNEKRLRERLDRVNALLGSPSKSE